MTTASLLLFRLMRSLAESCILYLSLFCFLYWIAAKECERVAAHETPRGSASSMLARRCQPLKVNCNGGQAKQQRQMSRMWNFPCRGRSERAAELVQFQQEWWELGEVLMPVGLCPAGGARLKREKDSGGYPRKGEPIIVSKVGP